VFDVFQEMADRQPEFVNVLTKNMLDICELVRFFAKCFKKANPVVTVNNAGGAGDDKAARGNGKNVF